jgi:hypothetical protein
MTSFDDRKKGQENQFAHKAELEFKATARRNKLLGLWAAEKLGKTGEEASQYAKDVVMADLEAAGHDDVIDKLLKDFGRAHLTISLNEITAEIERLTPIAEKQILEG